MQNQIAQKRNHTRVIVAKTIALLTGILPALASSPSLADDHTSKTSNTYIRGFVGLVSGNISYADSAQASLSWTAPDITVTTQIPVDPQLLAFAGLPSTLSVTVQDPISLEADIAFDYEIFAPLNTTGLGGAAIGKTWGNWSTELELNRVKFEFDSIDTTQHNFTITNANASAELLFGGMDMSGLQMASSSPAQGSTLTSTNVMANIWYTTSLGSHGGFAYAGAGIGHADLALNHDVYDMSGSAAIYQLGTGIGFPVNDTVSVGIGYRHMEVPILSDLKFESVARVGMIELKYAL